MVTALPFETEIFGRPCGRTTDPAEDKSGYWLVHYRGPDAPDFHHVGTLVTLRICGKAETASVRPAVAEDIGNCRRMAETFSHDRFHADPWIELKDANRLKAQWIENAIRGRAERVWVAEGGFLSILAGGRIDLICVEPKMRGRGIAKRLLSEAFRHYPQLIVGTQASNEESLKLYRSFRHEEIGRDEDWHWIDDRFVGEGEDRERTLAGGI